MSILSDLASGKRRPRKVDYGDAHEPCPTCGCLIFFRYTSIGSVECAQCNDCDRSRAKFLGMVVRGKDGNGNVIVDLRQHQDDREQSTNCRQDGLLEKIIGDRSAIYDPIFSPVPPDQLSDTWFDSLQDGTDAVLSFDAEKYKRSFHPDATRGKK